MRTPTEGVFYDSTRREHLIVVVLDATEAENIADALPFNDRGGDDLRAWADEARRLDNPEETR